MDWAVRGFSMRHLNVTALCARVDFLDSTNVSGKRDVRYGQVMLWSQAAASTSRASMKRDRLSEQPEWLSESPPGM